jgi:hypothetical protein
MGILQILLAIAPKVIQVAQQGQAAWEAFLEAQKIEGDDAINAKLLELQSEFIRHRIIAEAEANG